MPAPSSIAIDPAEEFLHLSRAPVVEAVMELKARAEAPWDERDIGERLKRELTDYPTTRSMQQFAVMMPFAIADTGLQESKIPAPSSTQEQHWFGYRLESMNGLQVGIFTRDGFSFSRLQPYEDWRRFSTEALRLWMVHSKLARPAEIQRIGVRFINRLDVPIDGLVFDDYLKGLASTPEGYPTSGFLCRDVLAVPGHPYAINLIRTVQPRQTPTATTVALLLDIDVYSLEPIPLDSDMIERRLSEMRVLKNRMFFSSITQKTVELHQ